MVSEKFENKKIISVAVDTRQFIELLEYKLESLKKDQEEDSSLNYDIERVEEIKTIEKQIEYYKSHL